MDEAHPRLHLACGRYDRTIALHDGTVGVDGVELQCFSPHPGEMFRRVIVEGEFDVSEMSLASHIVLTARGDGDLVGLPVFPLRLFRHSYIFVRADAGYEQPRDLRGGRVGVREYHLTSVVFARGMLSDDYGLRAADVEWFQGGLDYQERLTVDLPDDVTLHTVRDRSLDAMLLDGELDAIIAPAVLEAFRQGDPRVRRLWRDAKAVELEYFQRTGIFPIMHMIVARRSALERMPGLEGSLVEAFERAKRVGREEYLYPPAPFSSVPFAQHDIEEAEAVFGTDPYPYGLDANREVLATAVRYCREQGLIDRELPVASLFGYR